MADLEHYLNISNHLAGKLDIKAALRAVEADIRKIIEFDHFDVCIINDDGTGNASSEIGLRTGWSTRKARINNSPVRDILNGSTNEMVTGNALEDARYMFPGSDCGPIRQHGLKSRINVAMKVLGRTIGSLNCSSKKTDFYNEENVRQVRILSDVLAPYFFALRTNETAKREAVIRTKIQAREEGLRQGALRLTDALEVERQRIGMDLHDQTLGELTRIARGLKPGLDASQTERLQRDVQTCIQGVRNIIDTSIPSILELFGFQEAVQSHFEHAVGESDSPTFHYADDTGAVIDQLHETTRIALFRICQEALNNAISHSGASRIDVAVTSGNANSIILKISDNGVFQAARDEHVGGLTHMSTRARLIGADMTICKENGLAVAVQLPVPESRHQGADT